MAWKKDIERIAVGRKVFAVLVLSVLVLVGLYGYFVSRSVMNIVVRKEIERDIADVSSRISELETAYLERKNEITLEYAYANGFTDITSKHFAARIAPTLSQGVASNGPRNE